MLAICSFVAVLDGFDILAMAFAAPSVANELQIDISSFGAVFGIGSLGLMVGSLAFGSLADWFGRKPMIVSALLAIGLFSLLTPVTETFTQLLIVRLLAGIGLGGLMPNIIALTAEYSPRQWRATFVTLMFCGVPLGAMLAGLLSAGIIAQWGWRAVFYIGGAVAYVSVPIVYVFLPESLSFLAARRATSDRSLAASQRLDPGHGGWLRKGAPGSSEAGQARLAGLFAKKRAIATLLLWAIFFCNLLIWFFLTNWLPSILQRAHFAVESAALATVVLYAGGLVGGIALGCLVDKRMSYRLLASVYVLAAIFVNGIGLAADVHSPLLYVSVFGSGFFVGGSQHAINAIAANFYPTEMRSTGIGWSLGVGRIGSIVGPALGGVLIAMNWSAEQLAGVVGIPALVAALAALMIGWSTSAEQGEMMRKSSISN